MEDAGAITGGQGVALADPRRQEQDAAMVRRAFREGWPIPPERRQRLLTILQQIVETDTIDTPTMAGMVSVANHRNQIAAAKAILAAAAIDQADQHHLEKLASDEANPKSTDVRILVVDARGAERAIGIRELYLGAADAVPLPTHHPGGPQQEQGGDGGPARR